jgi:uncharacterized protein YeaO (DUF488 family)
MSISIVRLGSQRLKGEGLRIGTVRHLPRGVKKTDYARLDWFDVWLPNLAPSAPLIRKLLDGGVEKGWATFSKRFEAELKRPEAARVLDTLAALSHSAHFSLGCYCENENLCHRSILARVFRERGAAVK